MHTSVNFHKLDIFLSSLISANMPIYLHCRTIKATILEALQIHTSKLIK